MGSSRVVSWRAAKHGYRASLVAQLALISVQKIAVVNRRMFGLMEAGRRR